MRLSIIGWFIVFALATSGCTNKVDDVAFSQDGVEISFHEQGRGDPAIIFIHGWANNKSIWDGQISHFSEKYKVISIDLAGFGESGNNRIEWTMSAFAEDVSAVIKKLQLNKVVLVGFSLGAPVIIETAKKLPEHVLGIVLVDALQNVDMTYTPEYTSLIDSMMMDLVNFPTIEKMKGIFFKHNIEESYEHIISMLNNPKIGWRETLYENIRWNKEDCTESLSQIQVQVFAINSDRGPTDVKAFRQYNPLFQVRIIPDAGHIVMWDAKDEFNLLLEDIIQGYHKD